MADSIHQAGAALWDIILALLPLALVRIWPEMFPYWVAFVGIPLLICRYQIARLEQSLIPFSRRTTP